MVVTTGSVIYSETWNLLHALISGNVLDYPTNRGKKMIHGAFPDIEGKDYPGMPVIIIENPERVSDKQGFSTSGLMGNELSISIYAYSKAPKDLNILSEDISDAILSNRATLQASGHMLLGIDTGIQGTDIIGNQRIHFREQIARTRLIT